MLKNILVDEDLLFQTLIYTATELLDAKGNVRRNLSQDHKINIEQKSHMTSRSQSFESGKRHYRL